MYLAHIWHLSPSTQQLLRKYSRNTLPILLVSLSLLYDSSKNTCVSSSHWHLSPFTLQSTITPKVLQWYYSKGTLEILQKYLRIFFIFGIFLPPLYNYSENTLEILYHSPLCSSSTKSLCLPHIWHLSFSTLQSTIILQGALEILNFLTFGLFLSLLYNSCTNTCVPQSWYLSSSTV